MREYYFWEKVFLLKKKFFGEKFLFWKFFFGKKFVDEKKILKGKIFVKNFFWEKSKKILEKKF